MKKRILGFFRKIKNFFNDISDRFFFGKYKNTYKYINKKPSKLNIA